MKNIKNYLGMLFLCLGVFSITQASAMELAADGDGDERMQDAEPAAEAREAQAAARALAADDHKDIAQQFEHEDSDSEDAKTWRRAANKGEREQDFPLLDRLYEKFLQTEKNYKVTDWVKAKAEEGSFIAMYHCVKNYANGLNGGYSLGEEQTEDLLFYEVNLLVYTMLAIMTHDLMLGKLGEVLPKYDLMKGKMRYLLKKFDRQVTRGIDYKAILKRSAARFKKLADQGTHFPCLFIKFLESGIWFWSFDFGVMDEKSKAMSNAPQHKFAVGQWRPIVLNYIFGVLSQFDSWEAFYASKNEFDVAALSAFRDAELAKITPAPIE